MLWLWVGGPREMSLEPRAGQGVPELTARGVRAAFPKGTLAVRIREALGPLFEDEAFAEAFPARGTSGCLAGGVGLGVGVAVRGGADGPAGR